MYRSTKIAVVVGGLGLFLGLACVACSGEGDGQGTNDEGTATEDLGATKKPGDPPTVCKKGYANCDGDASNGCECAGTCSGSTCVHPSPPKKK